ncbi:S8 family serine peptidase [bacterium]|nr:S8 family serine peptidase [bacterium]
MHKVVFTLLFLLSFARLTAQKYYVYFTDKDGQQLNPYSYFDEHTIVRRLRCGVPLVQKTDLPVNENYVQQIQEAVDSIAVVSRWFNMAVVYASTEKMAEVATWSFVKKVEEAGPVFKQIAEEVIPVKKIKILHEYQTERMEGSLFTKNGITGRGVTVAVFDVGFIDADIHSGLQHLDIKATYDFVGKDENPYQGGTHGTSVLSVIGGKYGDTLLGLAPNAQYLLARTERNNSEPAGEEENWLAAAEWADKNGADVINSSLGYTFQRYFYDDMDGKTSLVAKAANMAFSKGIVVVVSAGNEGNGKWRYIGTPADADSVLSIGAIAPETDLRTSFSSYGPNAIGVLKPNISAPGWVFACSRRQSYTETAGTSFSSPLVAGFVACVMQQFPQLSHKEVFEKMQLCGHLYPYFDYAHGYGVPLASKFISPQNVPKQAEFSMELLSDTALKFNLLPPVVATIKTDSAEYLPQYIYFHIQSTQGILVYYKVVSIRNEEELPVYLELNNKGYALQAGDILRVYYNGVTRQMKYQP